MFGTLNTLDTLAASQQTVAQFGEDRAFEAIDAALRAHNQIADELMLGGGLIARSTDQMRRFGSAATMIMQEVDEFGRSDAQKITAGETLGFPLRAFDVTVQWTRKFMLNKTAAELAAQFTAASDAHIKRITREIKRALFVPTNYTFVDRLVNGIDIPVKRLTNADGASIPIGPNGETYDGSTHTHYLGTASLAVGDVVSLIETVREHYATGSQYLYINRAQEATIRTYTANFTAYLDARITPGSAVTTGNRALDDSNLYNRAIGLFNGAEVWVKPWVPSGYWVTWISGNPPLVLRERAAGGANLTLAAEDEAYPLRARTLDAEFGVGAWNRTAAAVLDGANHTTYTTPTITD